MWISLLAPTIIDCISKTQAVSRSAHENEEPRGWLCRKMVWERKKRSRCQNCIRLLSSVNILRKIPFSSKTNVYSISSCCIIATYNASHPRRQGIALLKRIREFLRVGSEEKKEAGTLTHSGDPEMKGDPRPGFLRSSPQNTPTGRLGVDGR